MNRLLQIAQIGAALAVALFFSVATWVTWQARSIPLHVNGVLTRAEGVESKLNASAINLDKATAAWSASAKVQAQAVTDLATQARGSLSAVDLTLASLRSNSDAINGEFASLQKTTDAATTLTAALATDAQTANGTIAAGKPLLEAYTQSGKDLDAILRLPAIPQTIDGLGTTSQNLGKISTDLYYWSHPVLHPEPCKTDKCRWGRVFGDITGYLGVASSGARVYNLFEPIPVTIKH